MIDLAEQTDFLQKRIGILGLGVNNLALVGWLLARGARSITVCDQNPAVRLVHPSWEQRLMWRLGPGYLDHLDDFEVVIRSPGIPWLSPAIQQAKAAGVEISSQTKLFFALSPARIIGVTGTKGKGTTASLIKEILEAEFKHRQAQNQRVFLAGNIGKDPFAFIDDLTKDDWVVLELSSFQLQDLEQSPDIAVVLNITSDHLDHHRSRDEYLAAKASIIRYQRPEQKAVVNFDSETALCFVAATSGEDWYFSRRTVVDRGVYVDWGENMAERGQPRSGSLHFRDETGRDQTLFRTNELLLRGEHNLENIGAAATAAYLAGCELATIRQIVPQFPGLEHRLERVGDLKGRVFYNDSFATNPEPVMAALASFYEPVHLIVGGSTKQADFGELGRFIAHDSSVVSLIPLGHVEGPRIAEAVRTQKPPPRLVVYPPVRSMKEAVELAVRKSQPGEVILLSPGCASFDLFANYKERGRAFKEIATKLGDTV